MDSGSRGASSGAKKSLQEMSREELVQKCKTLLAIAHKAKAAKDDAVKSLKESTDKSSALEEMVNSFSEQKVQSVSEVEKLTKELHKSNQVTLHCQKTLDELNKKFDTVETEKQVQDSQLKRLLSENQDLLEQIDSLDNALKSSKEEVISLSKENQNLEAKCQNSVAENICLKQRFQESSAENICSKQKCKDLECQIAAQLEKKEFDTKTLSEEIETEKSKLEMAKRNLQEEKQKLELERKEIDLEKSKSFDEIQQEKSEIEIAREKLRNKIQELEIKKDDIAKENSMKLIEKLKNDKEEFMKLKLEEFESEKFQFYQKEKQKLELERKEIILEQSAYLDEIEQEKNEIEIAREKLRIKIQEFDNKKDDIEKENSKLIEELKNDKEKLINEMQEFEIKKEFESEKSKLSEQVKLKMDEIQHETDKLQEEKQELIQALKLQDIETDLSEKSQFCEELKLKMDELQSEIEKLQNEKQELIRENEKLVSEFELQKQEIKINNDEKLEMNLRLKEFESEKSKFSEKVKLKMKEIQCETDKLQGEKQELIQEKEKIEIQTQEIEMEKEEISKYVLKTSNEFDAKKRELEVAEEKLEEKRQNIDKEIGNQSKSAKQIKFNEQIQSRKLENDCQNLKRNVQSLLAELNETKHLSQEMQAALNKDMFDLKNVFSEKTNSLVMETETHKNELLDEIRQMNEELMKRSSKLSAQEQEIESIKENGQNKLQVAENQIQSLKEQLLNSSMNTSMSISFTEKSEAMSTSTVSKVEETARMADVESSFEDRYSKLKIVAIKMKKKCNEQEKQIRELQQSSTKESQQKLSQLSANFSSLQLEYDNAQDTIEVLKKEVAELTKALKQSVEQCTETKLTLIATQDQLSQANSQNLELQSNLQKSDMDSSSLYVRLQEQEEKTKCLLQEKSELTLQVETASSKLASMSGMDKKHDLLDLELEEAEARIASLTTQHQEKLDELGRLEENLHQETQAKENRNLQIVELEQTLAKESQRASDLKEKYNDSRDTLAELESQKSASKCELENLSRENSGLRSENEKLSCQLSEVSGSLLQSETTLKCRNESLQKMVHLLEADLDRKKASVDELEGKLQGMEQEFDSYKVRAQSVLRQVKEKDSAIGAKAQELATLNRVITGLNEKIADMSTQFSATDLELKHVQEDHDRLMERHSALLTDMASKERQSRDKQENLVKLANSAEKARQDAIASLQEQTEALRQNYRSQMEELENKHTSEVAKLQKQIDALDNQIIRLQMSNSKRVHSPATSSSNATDVVNYLEREAAEGSEADPSNNRPTSVTPTTDPRFIRSVSMTRSESGDFYNNSGGKSRQTASPLIPLEQLLQQDQVSGIRDSPILKSNTELENRSVAAERRVGHMALLLSESEAENARLNELANVLKEEIRSNQRSEERMKHIENLEYVKNIIFKFITMAGSDEKSQLIPVLSTILKLSPTEVDSIQKVVASDLAAGSGAGGGGSTASTASQSLAEATSEVAWTSYLGLWSNN